MAEAFARMHGGDKVDAYSAGSRPSGKVNSKAIAAMKELGYDLSTHQSKSLDELPDTAFDAVITMGCGDECPWIPAKRREDWDLPDPKNMNEEEFREIRNDIERRVLQLIRTLQG